MTGEPVTYDFNYFIAEREGEGSVQFSPRPEGVETVKKWRELLLGQICKAIGDAESDLLLKTPNGWFGDLSIRQHEKTKQVAFLHVSVKGVPELSFRPDDYTFHKRVES